MQKNVVTKTFSTRRSSTGVVKRNEYEWRCNNTRLSIGMCLICYEKKCWTCKLQSKFYMQTTTYYVHETTNTRFTFENCGGCLKQIRKKNVRLLEPLKYNFNEQWVWSNKYSVYFWKQRRSFKTNLKIDIATTRVMDIYNCNNISVLTQQTLGLILKAVVVI